MGESGRQSRSCSLKVVKILQALAVMGDTDGVVVECLKAELEKAKKLVKEARTEQSVPVEEAPASADWTRWKPCSDACGHHRAACSRSGVLGRTGFSLESAAAGVCREAGKHVATNLFVRDMDLESRLWADVLPLFDGVQLAVDTTLVPAIQGDGQSQRRAADRGALGGSGSGGGRWVMAPCRSHL